MGINYFASAPSNPSLQKMPAIHSNTLAVRQILIAVLHSLDNSSCKRHRPTRTPALQSPMY